MLYGSRVTVGDRQWPHSGRPGLPPPPRQRRREGHVLTPLMLIAGCLLTALALLAGWAQWQLLDSDAFGDSSERLLEREEIRDRVAEYVVQEVRRAAGGSLPAELGANPERAVADQLDSRRARRTWRAVTTESHRELVRVIEDDRTANGDLVSLDLRRLISAVSTQLGVPLAVPEGVGRVTIVAGDEVSGARDAARQLERLAMFLLIAAPLMFALAVAVAAGWRMRALAGVGVAIAAAGVIVLLARAFTGSAVVDGLTSSSADRQAAEGVWSVLTSRLATASTVAIVLGVLLALAAGLAARSRERHV